MACGAPAQLDDTGSRKFYGLQNHSHFNASRPSDRCIHVAFLAVVLGHPAVALCVCVWGWLTIKQFGAAVGYGDIVPTTELEEAFTMVLMLVGAVMIAFIVGTSVDVLLGSGNEAQHAAHLREQARFLAKFAYGQNIPNELADRMHR